MRQNTLVVTVESIGAVQQRTSEAFEQAIAQEEPASIREAARLVDRDIKQVSENSERLEEYGVVEFVNDGRAKRPVVSYDEIDIQLPLRETVGRDAAPA